MSETPQHVAELSECARRLEAVARCSSAFLHEQLQALEQMGESLFAQQDGAAASGSEDASDRAEWIRQKAIEEQRIEEQLDHLAKAWKELESEQRRLMMLGAVGDRATGTNSLQSNRGESTPQRQSLDLIESATPAGAASAALQFQKLKREIRQQSRRHR